MTSSVEFGLDTFGDVTLAPDGSPLSHAQVLRNVIAEAEVADRVGVDAFGVEQEAVAGSLYVGAPDTVARRIAATGPRPGAGAVHDQVQRRHART